MLYTRDQYNIVSPLYLNYKKKKEGSGAAWLRALHPSPHGAPGKQVRGPCESHSVPPHGSRNPEPLLRAPQPWGGVPQADVPSSWGCSLGQVSGHLALLLLRKHPQ